MGAEAFVGRNNSSLFDHAVLGLWVTDYCWLCMFFESSARVLAQSCAWVQIGWYGFAPPRPSSQLVFSCQTYKKLLQCRTQKLERGSLWGFCGMRQTGCETLHISVSRGSLLYRSHLSSSRELLSLFSFSPWCSKALNLNRSSHQKLSVSALYDLTIIQVHFQHKSIPSLTETFIYSQPISIKWKAQHLFHCCAW